MQESPYLDVSESPDERMSKRRARRWKRRARIVGPFLGVSMVLVTLALSVDLIEYQPQEQPDRLSDRPMPAAVIDGGQQAKIAHTSSVSTTSVITHNRHNRVVATATGGEAGVDLRLVPLEAGAEQRREREFAPAAAPYSVRGIR
jgi:hypothetical protein